MLNKLSWKQDDGITLVELLASLAILSVVILLVGSVHIFGQRQFVNQTESASQTNDLSYALSVMSRDLRKLSVENDGIIITNDSIKKGETIIYSISNGKLLKKNTEVLANNVSGSFSSEKVVIENEDSSTEERLSNVIIKLKPSGSITTKEYQTSIYFRR